MYIITKYKNDYSNSLALAERVRASASWKVHGPRSSSAVRRECESIQRYVSRNFSVTDQIPREVDNSTVNSGNATRRGASEEISIHGERCSIHNTCATSYRSVLFMRFSVSTARIRGMPRTRQAHTHSDFHFHRGTGFTRHV